MFSSEFKTQIEKELQSMRDGGLFKAEKAIEGRLGTTIKVDGKKLINLCSNNYLGLAQHKGVIKAAQKALKEYSLGPNSVRFIVGTTGLHKELEASISKFFQTEEAILYTSCFDANAGLFEVLLSEGDVVFSDELNHASIIDGVRLCKAERSRFSHGNIEELEKHLMKAKGARRRLIVTDGVFSMDGEIAKLDELKTLADTYDALLVVDDSHGSGVLGRTGRGSIEKKGVLGKVDVLTSTFGKALGRAGGGFAAGRKEIIDLLRQRSRPYLFSNSLMPAIASAALFVLLHFDKDFLPLKEKLAGNTAYFRTKLEKLGYNLGGKEHPITPIMTMDEQKTMALADELLREGVYVRGFAYPVVPRGKGRVRVQISAAHTKKQLDAALEALERAGRRLGIIQ
ncbi:MAG: glycine C-acetyltransferase [Candidatus Yonathbacteria bacterium]|nr:glycine C-acetyltransferase [Candidatus Yonathbacteria bacterium]